MRKASTFVLYLRGPLPLALLFRFPSLFVRHPRRRYFPLFASAAASRRSRTPPDRRRLRWGARKERVDFRFLNKTNLRWFANGGGRIKLIFLTVPREIQRDSGKLANEEEQSVQDTIVKLLSFDVTYRSRVTSKFSWCARLLRGALHLRA